MKKLSFLGRIRIQVVRNGSADLLTHLMAGTPVCQFLQTYAVPWELFGRSPKKEKKITSLFYILFNIFCTSETVIIIMIILHSI